jgi:hypothetical protein
MFSEPLSAFVPDQSPEAEQLVAFVLDQLSVTDCPMIIDDGEADMETVGLGRGEVPPPPPPQAERKPRAAIKNSFAFISGSYNRHYESSLLQKKGNPRQCPDSPKVRSGSSTRSGPAVISWPLPS